MPNLLKYEHLIIIILVLLVALLVVSGGRGLGSLINGLLNKWFKKTDITINLGEGAMAGTSKKESPLTMFDPSLCAVCEREQAGRIRNEKEIEKLWENYGQLRTDMTLGFKEVMANINTTKDTILSALAGDRSGYKGSGKGGQD